MFIFFSKLTFFIIFTETNFYYSLNHPLIIKNYASSWCWWQNMVDGVSNFRISHQHLQAFHSNFRKILAFEKFIEVMIFEDFIRKILKFGGVYIFSSEPSREWITVSLSLFRLLFLLHQKFGAARPRRIGFMHAPNEMK